MTVTLTLGGTPLPLPAPDGIRIENVPIAAAQRMLNGTLRMQYRTAKKRITITWTNLTGSERTTLGSAWAGALAASKTLVLPDGTSCSVLAAKDPWSEAQFYDYADTGHFDVTLAFEEV